MIFLPSFIDSSNCWNTDQSQLQLQQIGGNTHITTPPSHDGPGDGGGNNSNQEGFMATARASARVGGDAGDGDGGDSGSGSSNLMSMSERARLARVPQPVPGLNCPRCDSTNTKLCYFNNYSLTQPRHFCRSCRRYWTRGGALRNVPVGGRYRRHAKRSVKPRAAASRAAAAGTTSSSTSCATASPGLQYSMFGSASSPGSWFADSFDTADHGVSCPVRLLFTDSGGYAADGCAQKHQHQAHGNEMEEWAVAQMDSFPFMHAMDHEMSGPPGEAMPITMAAMQGMFPPRAIERRRGQ